MTLRTISEKISFAYLYLDREMCYRERIQTGDTKKFCGANSRVNKRYVEILHAFSLSWSLRSIYLHRGFSQHLLLIRLLLFRERTPIRCSLNDNLSSRDRRITAIAKHIIIVSWSYYQYILRWSSYERRTLQGNFLIWVFLSFLFFFFCLLLPFNNCYLL